MVDSFCSMSAQNSSLYFPKVRNTATLLWKIIPSSSCSSFEARPCKVFMFMFGLAVGEKNHLPMSTGKPPVDITSLPLNGSLLSILFIIQIFLSSHFWRQIPIFNTQIWSLKFWRKKTMEKCINPTSFLSKSLQTKLLKSHLIEMCVNLGFFHKTLGFWGGGSKTPPNRSSVWNRTPTNLKVALKNLQVGEVETLEVETQI